ncbi:MAG: hypothetical protein ACLTEE_00810 [Anaerobutyricum hallii]
MNYIGGIDEFIKTEVLPFSPDAWVDEKKSQLGYELSFVKCFHKPVQLRSMAEIFEELKQIEKETDTMISAMMEENI